MINQPLRENDGIFLKKVFEEIRKIDPEILIDVTQYLFLVRIQLQSKEEFRARLFNKLHHIHRMFGLKFTPTEFIKRDKNIISFDLNSREG